MVEKSSTRFYQVEVSEAVRGGRECERFAWLGNDDIYGVDPFCTVAVFEDRNAEMFMIDVPMSEIEIIGIV